MIALETETTVGFSTEATSDYQAMLRAGWVDCGKAVSALKFLDRRIMKRTAEQAITERDYAARLETEKLAKLTKSQRRIREERLVLRNRGFDC